MTQPLSKCCGALPKVMGEGMTHWYGCSGCNAEFIPAEPAPKIWKCGHVGTRCTDELCFFDKNPASPTLGQWYEQEPYCRWEEHSRTNELGDRANYDIPAIIAEARNKERILLDSGYYIEFHRRSNNIFVSVRNKGDGSKGSRGGVALQYKIDLRTLLEMISEDLDERGNGIAVLDEGK